MPKLARVAPEIPVANLSESLAYYKAALGFETELTMPDGDYAIVERDDVALHLFEDNSGIQSPASLHIFATGLDELFAELQARGAQVRQTIVKQPWGNRDFRITDPNGNEIKFTEPLSDDSQD